MPDCHAQTNKLGALLGQRQRPESDPYHARGLYFMSALSTNRIGWLVRRLSRIYLTEVPYRLVGIVRTAVQRYGFLDASRPPPRRRNGAFGRSWIRAPQHEFVDSQLVIALADRILTNGLPVFNVTVPFHDGVPHWNHDPKTGRVIEKTFGLYIDFRHIGDEVDIKYLWEMNRHVWWVTLGQAYAVSGDGKYLEALSRLIDSWLRDCPYPLGANWSSPVEHGIRLINWSIVWHLIGGSSSPMFASPRGETLRDRWIDAVYQHLRFASDNYSFYSSADNHLIGEAAGVFVGSLTWDLWPDARNLRARAKRLLEEEILRQFSDDGVNFEQAICYHKFSLEFLLAALLCGAANQDDFTLPFKERMKRAIRFLASMMTCSGDMPNIGDSDDGKVFAFAGDGAASPYEAILRAGAAIFEDPRIVRKLESLGVLAYRDKSWIVAPAAVTESIVATSVHEDLERFDNGGYVVVGKALHSKSEFRITMDVGPLGYNRVAGHGHADALSVLISFHGQDFLVDPGTYCYNAASELRHYFRGTSAHNTVVVDGLDQSVYGGSFLWLRDVRTMIHQLADYGDTAVIEASHDGYKRLGDPVRHFRKLSLHRGTLEVVVEDRFECANSHAYELHWHFSCDCEISQVDGKFIAVRDLGRLEIQFESAGMDVNILTGANDNPLGWQSVKFYERQATRVLIAKGRVDSSSILRTRFTAAER